jgi:hypothetical protein
MCLKIMYPFLNTILVIIYIPEFAFINLQDMLLWLYVWAEQAKSDPV